MEWKNFSFFFESSKRYETGDKILIGEYYVFFRGRGIYDVSDIF